MVDNNCLALGEALSCFASNSDLCSPATALCGGRHLFGIRQYSPGLFWTGIFLMGASLLMMSRGRQQEEPR